MTSERVRLAPSDSKALSTISGESLNSDLPSDLHYGVYIAAIRLKPLNTNARANLPSIEVSERI